MPSIPPTGVIYARYSSHAQRDVSIEQQTRACRQFAQRSGIEVIKIYEDRAITGTSDKRPGFQQMVQDSAKADWSYVIVYTLDRFARDRYDSAVYKRQLKNSGVKVLSAMENISDDPTGVLMESLLEGLAEYYSRELSQKVLRGHEDNARKYLVNGRLPLGYVKGEDSRYAICEPEAEVVREIFRRVKAQESMTDIMGDLNDRGITTKTGHKWSRSSLNTLLHNERYTGVYIYRDIRVPGAIPAIISQELFDAVQVAVRTKPNPRKDPTGQIPQRRRRDNGLYLLTGKLYCGECQSAMTGVSGTSKTGDLHYYYTCKGRRRDHSSCNNGNVRREWIEELVTQSIKETMLTPTAIQALADASMDYQRRNSTSKELASLEAQLEEVNRSLNNLIRAVEMGIFSPTTQSRLNELEAQKQDLNRLINVAKADAEKDLTREEIIAALQLFQAGDIQDKNYQEDLIDTFLIRAYVYPDRMRLITNLGNKDQDTTIPFDISNIILDPIGVRFRGCMGDQIRKSTHRVGFLIWMGWGIRKAVKKTCRWHVFRPWENPFLSERTPCGCGLKEILFVLRNPYYYSPIKKTGIHFRGFQFFIGIGIQTGGIDPQTGAKSIRRTIS